MADIPLDIFHEGSWMVGRYFSKSCFLPKSLKDIMYSVYCNTHTDGLRQAWNNSRNKKDGRRWKLIRGQRRAGGCLLFKLELLQHCFVWGEGSCIICNDFFFHPHLGIPQPVACCITSVMLLFAFANIWAFKGKVLTFNPFACVQTSRSCWVSTNIALFDFSRGRYQPLCMHPTIMPHGADNTKTLDQSDSTWRKWINFTTSQLHVN